MSRNPAHGPGVVIVDLPLDDFSPEIRFLSRGKRSALPETFRPPRIRIDGSESGIRPSYRFENFFFIKPVEGKTALLLQYLSQKNKSGIAVEVPVPGAINRPFLMDTPVNRLLVKGTDLLFSV